MTEVKKAAVYDVARGEFTSRESAFKYVASSLEGKTVLDVGCNVGRHLEVFTSSSVGVDRFQPALELASAKKLSVVRADVHNGLPFRSKTFDGVFFAHLLEHVESPIRLLRECHRVLKQDGILIGCVPIEGTLFNLAVPYYGSDEHLYSFSLANIKVLLRKSDFEIEQVYFQLFPGRLFRSPLFTPLMDVAQHLPAFIVSRIARNYWFVSRKEREAPR